MADRVQFVDAHVHHWDLQHPWYPGIQAAASEEASSAGLHDTSGLRRNYLPSDYHSDSAAFEVTKVVHVSATTAGNSYLDEGRWLDQMHAATGWPAAFIGTLTPTDDLAVIDADIQTQAKSPLFRGVRVLFGLDPAAAKTADIFALLAGSGWLFEIVPRPGEVAAYLPRLERAAATTFVVEHAGWPESTDPDHFSQWRASLVDLAGLGNVVCKISGLPMALGITDSKQLRPWVQACLEVFGVDRCLFGSNFPVDALFGPYDEVLGAYLDATAGLPAQQRRQLFVTNAEGLYRI